MDFSSRLADVHHNESTVKFLLPALCLAGLTAAAGEPLPEPGSAPGELLDCHPAHLAVGDNSKGPVRVCFARTVTEVGAPSGTPAWDCRASWKYQSGVEVSTHACEPFSFSWAASRASRLAAVCPACCASVTPGAAVPPGESCRARARGGPPMSAAGSDHMLSGRRERAHARLGAAARSREHI